MPAARGSSRKPSTGEAREKGRPRRAGDGHSGRNPCGLGFRARGSVMPSAASRGAPLLPRRGGGEKKQSIAAHKSLGRLHQHAPLRRLFRRRRGDPARRQPPQPQRTDPGHRSSTGNSRGRASTTSRASGTTTACPRPGRSRFGDATRLPPRGPRTRRNPLGPSKQGRSEPSRDQRGPTAGPNDCPNATRLNRRWMKAPGHFQERDDSHPRFRRIADSSRPRGPGRGHNGPSLVLIQVEVHVTPPPLVW